MNDQLIKIKRSYSWKRDPFDFRDFNYIRYVQQNSKNQINPKSFRKNQVQTSPIDLRAMPLDPPVLDQGSLGSCTAFATTALVNFCRDKQKLPDFVPSSLFTYYTTRQIEGTTNSDSGAYVRNALKSTVTYGVVSENLWPYDINKYKIQPPSNVYTEALKHQTLKYMRIPDGNIQALKYCLTEGYPFIFGMIVFEQFESNKCLSDGIVELPKNKKVGILGGHAMMCIGWKLINNTEYFICQNSWGGAYGDKGFWYVPVAYLKNKRLSGDFWTIRLME